MANASRRGRRRSSSRVKYRPRRAVPPGRGGKAPGVIPRRSFRLRALPREIGNQSLRRSPRLRVESASEGSGQALLRIGAILNVDDLLKTGYFDGVSVTCFSETRKGDIPGVIKTGGFLCGCSECNYTGEVLSARMFEKHAGANTKFQADHVFFGNGLNLYEVSQAVTNIPEEDVCVKILKLGADLKQNHSSEEPPLSPTKNITARRSGRKRREAAFQKPNALEENNSSKRLRTLLRSEDADMNEEFTVAEISCAKDLLKTGLLEGASVTYNSEKNRVKLPGMIKGTGYVCSCPKCTYTGEALSAVKFEEHAQCETSNPDDCVFLSNGISIFEVAQKLKGIHGNALKSKLSELVSEVDIQDYAQVKKNAQVNLYDLEKVKSSEGSNNLQESSESASHVLKYYRRYHPRMPLMDVQGLLSTGILEGFTVTYMSNKARLMASIQGAGYRCGCSSCNNNTKVITAREIVRHAGEFSDNPYDSIYLDNGMTLRQLVKIFKGTPLHSLGDFLQEKIKCYPNNSSFNISKDSLEMNDDTPSFGSDSERWANCRLSLIPCISRDEVRLLEATRNTDASNWGDDYSVKNHESNSDQFLNQHAESDNSNFQHCPVSQSTIASNLAQTFADGVPEGINDLTENLIPENMFQSISRVEASIIEATKNDNWMENASCVRENDGLSDLGTNLDQFLNQPNESTNSNFQKYSVCKPATFTHPAGTVIDNNTEDISDLSKASVTMSSLEPYNVELDAAPGTGGVHTHGPCISDGMSVFCKAILTPAARKSRSPRIVKFRKHNDSIYAGPSSLSEMTVQNVKFTSSGMEAITASDITEAAITNSDYNHLESESNERLRDEKSPLIGVAMKRRDGNLHKRIFEEGGLPDGTVLSYQHQNKVIRTGVKQGNIIKCDCHNLEWAPSQFEAHAGYGRKRQPYRNIYSSDGKSLHELSLELPDISRSDSGILDSMQIIHRQRHERTTSVLVKKDHFVATSRRLKRIIQTQKGVFVRCSSCKQEHAPLGDEADPKLVVFCNQCDRAYHIGCLEDQKSFKIEDVFNGNWFCCFDCTWVHSSLKNICTLGAKAVPTPFLDLLKKPHTTVNNPVNLSWQIFRGGDTKDRVLLSQSLQLLKSVFKPILLGRQDMMRQMIFGKQVAGTGLDFRGVLLIMIKTNEEIVSVAALRVFGKSAAELPLATTSKPWRQQGYFRVLLSLVEELLRLLHVRLLVSPVHDKMQSVWIEKFGFAEASDQKVRMLKEQHGVTLFEDTALLEKEIQAVTD